MIIRIDLFCPLQCSRIHTNCSEVFIAIFFAFTRQKIIDEMCFLRAPYGAEKDWTIGRGRTNHLESFANVLTAENEESKMYRYSKKCDGIAKDRGK